MNTSNQLSKMQRGFTIVELLIVVVVIAILAAITIVSYNGITDRAREVKVQDAAKQGYTTVTVYALEHNETYPDPSELAGLGLINTDSTTYEYEVDNSSNPHTFCLSVTEGTKSQYVDQNNSVPKQGLCP